MFYEHSDDYLDEHSDIDIYENDRLYEHIDEHSYKCSNDNSFR